MSISCKSLYEAITREVGVGVGSDRLASSFVLATNSTLDRLSIAIDRASKYSHISSTSDIITSISNHYFYIVYSGILYHIIRMGHKPADPRIAQAVLADSERMWESARGDFMQDSDNITQSTDSGSVFGLGYVNN